MTIMGSLNFLNPAGDCGETGSFGGGTDGENTGGDCGVTGGGDACGWYDDAVCCAGSCRGVPQFSQNDWPGSAFVPHIGQKGIPINIPWTINLKKRFYISLWIPGFFIKIIARCFSCRRTWDMTAIAFPVFAYITWDKITWWWERVFLIPRSSGYGKKISFRLLYNRGYDYNSYRKIPVATRELFLWDDYSWKKLLVFWYLLSACQHVQCR